MHVWTYKCLQRQIGIDTQPHTEIGTNTHGYVYTETTIGKYGQLNYIDTKTCIHTHAQKHLYMCTLTRGQAWHTDTPILRPGP